MRCGESVDIWGGGCWFGRHGVAVCDDEDAADCDGDGENFGPADLFAEQGDAEDVGEEGGAVVDSGEVACSCQVDCDIPRATCDGQGAGQRGNGPYHIRPW